MQTTIKAIETRYNGYRFRSRLEARWAVFFDALGVKYEYEKEGFDLGDAGWYLPDFWLPEQECWIEIKGQDPSQDDLVKVAALSAIARKRLFLLTGECSSKTKGDAYIPIGDDWPMPYRQVFNFARFTEFTAPDLSVDDTGLEAILNRVHDQKLAWAAWRNKHLEFWISSMGVCHMRPAHWVQCLKCKRIFMMASIDWNMPCMCGKGITQDEDKSLFTGAYRAARSARFEHGEHGR